ncbi:MAG: phospholipase D family protein [Verrucomicrobia bacterium]|nr:phospholipase D family protein [Verrucomicrobiota bacterium]
MRTFAFGCILLLSPLLSPAPQVRASPTLLEKLFSSGSPDQRPTPERPRSSNAAESQIPAPEVYFSPRGGCTEAVVRELSAARQTVLVQAYSFTSAPIAAALVEASRRGVRVEAVLDKSNKTGKYSEADFLVNARIPTYLDDKHAIAHNKVMIIDDQTLITGSFNFTKAAEESNAENLLILRSPKLAAQYTASFLQHRDHSVPYARH